MGAREKIMGIKGSHWTVLIAAICIYLITFLANPEMARAAVESSLKEIQKLAVPIAIAIFFGGLVKNLITREFVSKLFGTSEPKELLTAGIVGSILPPCPFVAYPVIKGFREAGMRFPVFMTMLVTSTIVEIPQIFAGLVILGLVIEGARIFFAFLASMVVGYIFLIYTHRPGIHVSHE